MNDLNTHPAEKIFNEIALVLAHSRHFGAEDKLSKAEPCFRDVFNALSDPSFQDSFNEVVALGVQDSEAITHTIIANSRGEVIVGEGALDKESGIYTSPSKEKLQVKGVMSHADLVRRYRLAKLNFLSSVDNYIIRPT